MGNFNSIHDILLYCTLKINQLELAEIKRNVLTKLEGLDKRLIYHNIAHTLDVMEQTLRIASFDDTLTEREIYLLHLAALYHDTGFLEIYMGHEEVSCRYFLEDAGNFGINKEEEAIVTGIIMATKVSNQPKTVLERIIRDADLDYLGREDFPEISLTLKKELFDFGFISNEEEWNNKQLDFLRNHQYNTVISLAEREPIKQKNLQALLHH